jgi:hypothetical protein
MAWYFWVLLYDCSIPTGDGHLHYPIQGYRPGFFFPACDISVDVVTPETVACKMFNDMSLWGDDTGGINQELSIAHLMSTRQQWYGVKRSIWLLCRSATLVSLTVTVGPIFCGLVSLNWQTLGDALIFHLPFILRSCQTSQFGKLEIANSWRCCVMHTVLPKVLWLQLYWLPCLEWNLSFDPYKSFEVLTQRLFNLLLAIKKINVCQASWLKALEIN